MNVPGTQHVFPSRLGSNMYICRQHAGMLREPIQILTEDGIVIACPSCWADERPQLMPARDVPIFDPIVPKACVDKNCPFTAKDICENCGSDMCNRHTFQKGMCNWCADYKGLTGDGVGENSGCGSCATPPVFHCNGCGIGTCRSHASTSKIGLCVYCENGPWKLK